MNLNELRFSHRIRLLRLPRRTNAQRLQGTQRKQSSVQKTFTGTHPTPQISDDDDHGQFTKKTKPSPHYGQAIHARPVTDKFEANIPLNLQTVNSIRRFNERLQAIAHRQKTDISLIQSCEPPSDIALTSVAPSTLKAGLDHAPAQVCRAARSNRPPFSRGGLDHRFCRLVCSKRSLPLGLILPDCSQGNFPACHP